MATCKNGHYYPDDQSTCPYCPSFPAVAAAGNRPAADALRTIPGVPAGFKPIPEPTAPPVDQPEKIPAGASALYTQISTGEPSSTQQVRPESQERRLTGWLVTFDRQPLGQDFRLREGRNTIGTAPDCEVRIEGDPNISGRHLTILFRLGNVLFRDELSTNGTFINEHLTNEGSLQDGDVIRTGNTRFLFRTATLPTD
ncbi:MAG: FHA domain-containing protein [Sphingobacteriales bacterium]|nr:MAG: FHA domain-containing protein [Sphingobacteriales bacterium]